MPFHSLTEEMCEECADRRSGRCSRDALGRDRHRQRRHDRRGDAGGPRGRGLVHRGHPPPGDRNVREWPGDPAAQRGSFELQTLTNPEKVQLFTDLYDGTALSAIDGIGYSTYRDPASTGFVAGVAALNLRVDLTNDGVPDVYMVYEPYQDMGNAAVLTGVSQDWDAYRGGAAKWWINTNAGGCARTLPAHGR